MHWCLLFLFSSLGRRGRILRELHDIRIGHRWVKEIQIQFLNLYGNKCDLVFIICSHPDPGGRPLLRHRLAPLPQAKEAGEALEGTSEDFPHKNK